MFMIWTTTTTPTMDEHNREAMERVVEERASSLEETVQDAVRPGVMQRLRRSVVPYALLAGGFLTSLAGAAVASAADQYLTVVTKAQGVGGTQWKSEVVLQNPSMTETVYGELHLLPGNGDDRALSYSIFPRGSLTIDDPVGQVGLTGNAAVRITNEGEAAPGVTTRFWNEQDYDGDASTTTQLSQYLQAQALDNFLQPGDVAWLTGPDVTLHEGVEANRMNVFFVSAPNGEGVAATRYRVETFNANGEMVTSTFLDIGERTQKTDFARTVFGIEPQTGDTYKFTLLKGNGWFTASSPQNNQDLPGYDDAGSTTPTIERLVQEGYFFSGPNKVETNDPVAITIIGKSRPGTEILGGTIDGAVGTHFDGNGTNQLQWTYTGTPTVAGTYENSAGFTVKDEGGAEYTRTLPAHLLTVIPEDADFTPDDSYNKTKTSIEELATLIGENINTVFINTNYHYGTADVREILEVYTNGTTGDQNPELDRVIIKDGTNSVDYRRTDGGTAVWAGFTETQMDRLKDIYK